MASDRPRFIHCANCQKRVQVGPMGRVPVFCGNNCRQQAFVQNNPPPANDRQRAVFWGVLQEAGLIPADRPLPMRKPENAA